jgi:hypothetical protein
MSHLPLPAAVAIMAFVSYAATFMGERLPVRDLNAIVLVLRMTGYAEIGDELVLLL